MHLLLVDDEISLLQLLSQHLIRLGHTVEACGNVAQAKRALEQSFDAAIVDWTLPDGTGLDIGLELLERDANIKIVFTSGYPLDLTGVPKQLHGRVQILQKPFLPRALAAMLSPSLPSS